jgi:hypothetical protein
MNRSFAVILLLLPLLLPQRAFGQEFALSTNALDYAQLGTLNIEAAYGFARHWSVQLGVKYNPFSFESSRGRFQARQRLVRTGARWWPWHVYSGWWVGARAQWQEYSRGGFESPVTTEGDRFGGGLSAGYAYMLGKHWNLDVGIGAWAGYDRYRSYECMHCGKMRVSGGKYFVLPDDFILSVVYIF